MNKKNKHSRQTSESSNISLQKKSSINMSSAQMKKFMKAHVKKQEEIKQ